MSNYYHAKLNNAYGPKEYFNCAQDETHFRELINAKFGTCFITEIKVLDIREQIAKYEEKRRQNQEYVQKNMKATLSVLEQITFYEKCTYLGEKKDLFLYKIQFINTTLDLVTERLLLDSEEEAIDLIKAKHRIAEDHILTIDVINAKEKLEAKKTLLEHLRLRQEELERYTKKFKKTLSSLEHTQNIMIQEEAKKQKQEKKLLA